MATRNSVQGECDKEGETGLVERDEASIIHVVVLRVLQRDKPPWTTVHTRTTSRRRRRRRDVWLEASHLLSLSLAFSLSFSLSLPWENLTRCKLFERVRHSKLENIHANIHVGRARDYDRCTRTSRLIFFSRRKGGDTRALLFVSRPTFMVERRGWEDCAMKFVKEGAVETRGVGSMLDIDGITYIYGKLFLILVGCSRVSLWLFGGESIFFIFFFILLIVSYRVSCRVVQVTNKFCLITVINPMIKYAELYK